MAKKQSMADALERNKRLRQQIASQPDDDNTDRKLTVLNGTSEPNAAKASPKASGKPSSQNAPADSKESQLTPDEANHDTEIEMQPRTVWVRHTVGLRDQNQPEAARSHPCSKEKGPARKASSRRAAKRARAC